MKVHVNRHECQGPFFATPGSNTSPEYGITPSSSMRSGTELYLEHAVFFVRFKAGADHGAAIIFQRFGVTDCLPRDPPRIVVHCSSPPPGACTGSSSGCVCSMELIFIKASRIYAIVQFLLAQHFLSFLRNKCFSRFKHFLARDRDRCRRYAASLLIGPK